VRQIGLLLLLATALSPARAEEVWVGRTRAELVAVLGEPSSDKRTPEGGERLVYKLYRLEEGAQPTGMVVISLPGIGPLGRPAHERVTEETLSLEPTVVGDDGRLASGGVTATQSRGISWSKAEGKRETPEPAADETARRGRIKVAFELDRSGAIREWYALPRRHGS
jgi:hypothetical protein